MKSEERAVKKTETGILFDTDVLVWYFRGSEKAVEFIEGVAFENRTVSSLCVMELVQGCRNKRELRTVKAFLKENIAGFIHPDEAIAEKAIRLLEEYSLSHGLKTVDAIVAASAMIMASSLATGNYRHFESLRGLRVMRFVP